MRLSRRSVRSDNSALQIPPPDSEAAAASFDTPAARIRRLPANSKIIYSVVCIALLMASIDQTIVATALTTIQHDLHTQVKWSSWTITVYSLGQLVTLPVAGKIADNYGRKRIFVIAVAVFTIASLCCSLAGNIYVLIAFRALQAIGGGAFMPCATGIVADHFGENRDRAIGLFTSFLPIGAIIGPVLGGIIVNYWSWRVIFLINVPIGIIVLICAIRFLPPSESEPSGRPDFVGGLLLGGTLLSAMFGLSSVRNGSSPFGPRFFAAEVCAAALGSLFLFRSKRDPDSIVPMRLLIGRGYGVINLINVLFGAAALGLGTLIPLYAEIRFGLRPVEAGTLLGARAIGMICVAGLAAFALRRTGYRAPMLLGLLLTALGLAAISVEPQGLRPEVWLACSAAVAGIGMGMTVPAANNASLQLAPNEISAIAGLRGMFRQSGSILAISTTSIIVSHSDHPAEALAHVYAAFALVLFCVAFLTPLVPEHRGSW